MSRPLALVKYKVIKFMAVFRSGTCINNLDELTDSSTKNTLTNNRLRMIQSDPPELHVSGRMAGTGTAVAGTGTRDVGCQLR